MSNSLSLEALRHPWKKPETKPSNILSPPLIRTNLLFRAGGMARKLFLPLTFPMVSIPFRRPLKISSMLPLRFLVGGATSPVTNNRNPSGHGNSFV